MSDGDIEALPGQVIEDATPPRSPHETVLQIRDLHVTFKTEDGPVYAVRGVDLDVAEGEVLGIVGESGSGKSVTSLAILGLLPKTATVTGEVWIGEQNLIGLKEKELQTLRGRTIAMVFQDALAALNPVYRVGDQIAEAIRVHNDMSKGEVQGRVIELLDLVGIPQARQRAEQYPHQFSGGMRQRAMIAMALANDPKVLIADEPTTALDVTIQAQVLDVFERVQDRTNTSIILITHDLGVVAGVADRVVVMYGGRHVEAGTVDDIFYESKHPYALGLLESLPRLDRRYGDERLIRIKGQPPSLIFLPRGCAFHPRCRYADLKGVCVTERPELHEIGPGHASACHFAETLDDRPVHDE